MRFGPGALRISLALLVVLSHMSRIGLGRPSVMVFFMLSGYWVSKMYSEKYAGRAHVGTFYLSRLLRIGLPFVAIYLIGAITYVLVDLPMYTGRLVPLLLFGTASNPDPDADLLGVTWSLDMEMQFYLLVPLLVTAYCASRRWVPLTAFMGLLIVGGGVLAVTTGVVLVTSYMTCFIAGLLIWHLDVTPSRRRAAASVAAFVLAGLAIIAVPATRGLIIGTHGSPGLDLFLMVWVLLLVPFVAWNVRQPSSALDRHLGNVSYPLYLCHVATIAIGRAALGQGTPKVTLLGLIIVATAIAYIGIDRPAERLRVVIMRRLARTTPAAEEELRPSSSQGTTTTTDDGDRSKTITPASVPD